jgi:hypothetical protein
MDHRTSILTDSSARTAGKPWVPSRLGLFLLMCGACEASVAAPGEPIAAAEGALRTDPTADEPAWFRSDFGVARGFAMSIVPDQRDRNVAYLISLRQVDELTSRRELYVTRTGGAFWRRLDGVVDGEQAISGIVTHGRRQAYLGLGFPGALLHTRNGGITWHDVTRGFDEPPTYIQPLAVASDEPRTLYIAAGTERSRLVNLFVSGNSGRTWTFAPTGIARGCCCGSALARPKLTRM